MSYIEYVVIEFLEEKAVEAVPKSWIEHTDQGLYSYWPRFNAAQRVKKGELPDKEKWTKYKVRIFVTTGCYQKALLKAKQAEETSNVESDEEHKPRPKKRPQRYINWSEEENGDDEDEDEELKKRRKPQVETLSKFSAHSGQLSLPKPPEMEEYFADFKISSFPAAASRMTSPLPSTSTQERTIERLLSASSTPLSSLMPKHSVLNELFTDNSTETKRPGSKKVQDSSDNFQLSVLMKLDKIIENQQEQLALLRKIIFTTQGPDTEYSDEIIATPLDSVEELEGFCERLKENPELFKKMTCYLSSLGGCNLRDSVRRMMKRLGTKRLWSLYSLKGRKGKKAFQDIMICRVLTKACLKNNSKSKEREIEEAISETLKYAPNQRGGINCKVPEQKKEITFGVEEETNSDS